MDISIDISMDISMDISIDISMDISMDIAMDIYMDFQTRGENLRWFPPYLRCVQDALPEIPQPFQQFHFCCV